MKPPSDLRASTIAYYNNHAEEFCRRTISADMGALYEPFLECMRPGGLILDAGCGSGRDSREFLSRGYRVFSIDASAEMVSATTLLTGQPAVLMAFEDISFREEFDGIWACASLLHIQRQELRSVLTKFVEALKPGGVIYFSFKYGDEEREEAGRYFNDMNEDRLSECLDSAVLLHNLRTWTSTDVRDARTLRWLNAIAFRATSVP